jgi:curli biogenesis system outer membrane secretion channel CsgG
MTTGDGGARLRAMRPARLIAGLLLCLPCATAVAVDDARPVLGVLKFQDETGGMFLSGGVGRSLTQMLTNELSANGAFTVVERQKLRAVLEEQNLSTSGLVSRESSIQIGKLTGAQYLVTGTVTAFEENVETTTRGGMFRRARVETVSNGGYLAVDLRVIDTTTGEISFARTVEGRTEARKVEGAIRDVSVQQIDDGPGARAVRAAVIEMVDYLGCAMVRRDACLAEFDAREQRRIEATRKAAKID